MGKVYAIFFLAAVFGLHASALPMPGSDAAAHTLAKHEHCHDALPGSECSDYTHLCFIDNEYTGSCLLSCGICEGKANDIVYRGPENLTIKSDGDSAGCVDKMENVECAFYLANGACDAVEGKCAATCGECEGAQLKSNKHQKRKNTN